MSSSTPPAATLLMTAQEVAHQLRITVRILHRMVATGEFPKPVVSRHKFTRWATKDVESFARALLSRAS